MHIDHDTLALHNESDVEQKIVMPLLGEGIYLEIFERSDFSKAVLGPYCSR